MMLMVSDARKRRNSGEVMMSVERKRRRVEEVMAGVERKRRRVEGGIEEVVVGYKRKSKSWWVMKERGERQMR